LYRHLQHVTAGSADLAAFSAGQATFGVVRAGKAEPARSVSGEFVSGNYFTMFGLAPYAGRTLAPADDRPGASPVAVLSHRAWMQQFGGDASIVGSGLTLNNRTFTVVGIAPPGFFGETLRSNPPGLFLPLNTEPLVEDDPALVRHDTHWLAVMGRVAGGVSSAVEAR